MDDELRSALDGITREVVVVQTQVTEVDKKATRLFEMVSDEPDSLMSRVSAMEAKCNERHARKAGSGIAGALNGKTGTVLKVFAAIGAAIAAGVAAFMAG